MKTPLSSILLVLFASFVGSFGSVFLKAGADKLERTIRGVLTNWRLFAGIVIYLTSFGMYAVAEILRYAITIDAPATMTQKKIGNIFRGQLPMMWKYRWPIMRGNVVGTLIGALPGAGADVAAWISYAMAKKFSKEPEKFGTGHVEGIAEERFWWKRLAGAVAAEVSHRDLDGVIG